MQTQLTDIDGLVETLRELKSLSFKPASKTSIAHRRSWEKVLIHTTVEQGHGNLRKRVTPDRSKYCCLGLACEVSGLGVWTQQGDELYAYVVGTDTRSGTLPYHVDSFFGFTNREADLFIRLNDTYGFTFQEIAQVVHWFVENATVEGEQQP